MTRPDPPPAADARAERAKAVQQAFVQTLRNHSIPSDWLECQLLRGSTGSGRQGAHVQFIVHQGGPTLLPHVDQFEHSFLRNLERQLTDARKWVLGMAWVLNDRPPEPMAPGWALPPDAAEAHLVA